MVSVDLGLIVALSLLTKSSSSPVNGSVIGRCILTAVFVRSRTARRFGSSHSGVLGCYAVRRVDW